MKILHADDVDKVLITAYYYKDSTNCKDVVVEFPEEYGIEPISFVETGLINAIPEIEAVDINVHIPRVQMNFYGKLNRVFVDDDSEEVVDE